MLTTDQKGAIVEAAIARAALELGLARPVGDEHYDLIFDFVIASCVCSANGRVVEERS
jgi:hypothetical protein